MSRSESAAVVQRAVAVLRSMRGWSQCRFAAAAGVAESTVSRCESGAQVPTRRTFERLVAAADLSPKLLEDILAWIRESLSTPGGPVRWAEPARVAPAAAEMTAAMARLEAVAVSSRSTNREAIPLFTPSEARRREALEQWALLEPLSVEERLFLVGEAPEYHRWELCEVLCELSLKAAAHQAERATELASLAVEIAKRVQGEPGYGERLRGAVLGHFANALRVAGALPAAADRFTIACKLWKSGTDGTSDFLSEARLLSLQASLRMDQRRPAEALEMIRRALPTASQSEKRKLLLQLADVLSLSGDFEGAIAALQEAAPFISRAAEPRLFCILRFNLLENLLQAGRVKEAEDVLLDVQELTAHLANDLDILRLRWLEGHLAAGLGQREAAIAALQEVREGFAARKIAYDTALASLELAVLYLEEGRTSELKKITGEMVWIFQAQEVHRETLAALQVFCEAVRKEEATVELAQRVVGYLQKAQSQPELWFEAGLAAP